MTMQDLTGHTLGQYHLRELIGAGGMGAVYRGYQTTLERAVAVKVLSTVLASETGYVERFYREAKTSAALEHAHIVPVHDFGIQGNLSYVVMRLLTGGTLAERMQSRADRDDPLPSLGEVSALLTQLAGALDYAHSQNVIHRDIKPSNIMFDNQGNAYLVDFGIAKLLEATSALTGTGTTMGTPAFMPPEQWRSEELSATADQYALAATMYALMIGRAPYEATTPFGLMHKHLNEMPTPPHVERPDVPEAMTLVIERALAKVPSDRFPTVTAFAQAFDSAIRGQVGEKTGFFVTKLPPKDPPTLVTQSQPTPAVPPYPGMDAVPSPMPPPPTPVSAQTPAEPSMVFTPTEARRPSARSPLIWGLAVALIAAVIVIGVLVFGGDDGGGGERDASATAAASSPAAGAGVATEESSATPAITPTEEPTATNTAEPTEEGGLIVLPTDTPRPTDTPTEEPTATPTSTPTATPTATPEPTATPTNTPTATPTQTPEPTPTPLPPPTAVAMGGQPVLVVGGLGTFLREAPEFGAPQIAISDVTLLILGVSPDHNWFLVELDGQAGWVRNSALVTVEGDLDAVPVVEMAVGQPGAPGEAVLVVEGSAFLREAPEFGGRQTTISNVTLPILGISPDGNWFMVEWEGQPGWVLNSALVAVEGNLDAVPVVEPEAMQPGAPSEAVLVIGGLGAYLREAPEFGAPQTAIADVTLPIFGISPDGNWFLVEWEGQPRWVRDSALVTVEGNLDGVPVVEPEAMQPGAPGEAVLVIGGLGAYLREAPEFGAPQTAIADVTLPILGISPDGNWFLVEFEGQPGWVRNSALVTVEGNLDAVPVVEPEAMQPGAPGEAVLVIGGLGAYLRTEPAFGAPQTAIANVTLPILGMSPDGNWFMVEFEGQPGWVRNSALVRVDGNLDAVPVLEGDESPDLSVRSGRVFGGVLFADRFERNTLESWESWGGSMEIGQEGGNGILVITSLGDEWGTVSPARPVSGDYSLAARVNIVRPQNEFSDVYLRVRVGERTNVDTYLSVVNGTVGIGYWHDPDWTVQDERSVTVNTNQWYHMRVDVVGNEVRLFVNGRPVAAAQIPELPDGTIDIGTSPGAVIWVDDVVVLSLDHSPDAMSGVRRARVTANVNVRFRPGTETAIIGGLQQNNEVLVIDADPDQGWLYVRQDESGVQGWVTAEFLELIR
jgi:serine/threonine protein kinase